MTTTPEWLERRLETLSRAYHGGNLGALYDAVGYCEREHVPLPDWASAPLRALLVQDLGGGEKPTKQRGRQARWLRKYRDDMVDLERYETVGLCDEHGIPPRHRYYAAHLALTGTWAAGSDDVIKKSHERVQQRLEAEPYRYYILDFLQPKPRDSDVYDPERAKIWEEIERLKQPSVSDHPE